MEVPMKPLSKPSRRLMEAARAAANPSAIDRDRVRARVMAAVLAGGSVATSAALAEAAATSTKAAALAGKSAALTAGTPGLAKAILIGALLGLGAVSTAEVVSSKSALPPPTTVSAPVVAQEPLPPPTIAPPGEAAPPEEPRSEPPPARVEPRPATPAPAASLREEIAILKEAQRAIQAGETGRAVELLDTHARKFAGGSLKEERLAARAIALCDAGRTAEARRAVAQFFAEVRVSPLEARVRAACKDAMPSGPGD
jgi:hypothetical protein